MKLFSGFLITLLTISAQAQAQEIAITIDDVPRSNSELYSGEERTKKLIDSVKKANIPEVLLFVITNNITEKSRKRVEAYTQAGFYLGNHSHNHFSAHNKDIKTYLADITLAQDELKKLDNVVPFYRYPYLHEGADRETRDGIRKYLLKSGYENGYVTVDNYDWYMDSLLQNALANGKQVNYSALKKAYVSILWDAITFYDDLAKETLGRSPKHVLLLHENDLAALYLGDLIEHIRSKGWKMISAREAYEDPIANEVPDVLYNGQGRISAIAKSKGWDEEFLRDGASNEEYLDAYFEDKDVYK